MMNMDEVAGIIKEGFKFDQFDHPRDFMKFRKENMKITGVLWIALEPRIFYDEIFTPKVPLIVFLN